MRPWRSNTAQRTSAARGRSSANSTAPRDGFGKPFESASSPSWDSSIASFRRGLPTWIVVEAVSAIVFAAMKSTLKFPVTAGVQVNVPLLWSGLDTNVAPLLAGMVRGTMISDAIGFPSGSDAVTVNVIFVPLVPFTVPGATTTGARSTTVGTYSNTPRSANATGPAPVFRVAGSSTRAPPAASVAGQLATPELPASIAGEPARRWKSPAAPFTNRGSAWREWASWPLAAWYCASVAYFVVMNLYGVCEVEFQNRL